jgi:N utilization substance protein B
VKVSTDPRHIRREEAVKSLFSHPFVSKKQTGNPLARSVLLHKRKVDNLIRAAAPEWSLEKINRIDLAILRLASWELVIEKKNPPKVIIDEAVELAKKYGAEGSPGFINGVLGTIYHATTKI